MTQLHNQKLQDTRNELLAIINFQVGLKPASKDEMINAVKLIMQDGKYIS